jgi:hypothetical protein
MISPLLKASVRRKQPHCATPNWRVNKKNFVSLRHGCRSLEPGAITFSAGWFAQGHEVPMVMLSEYSNTNI